MTENWDSDRIHLMLAAFAGLQRRQRIFLNGALEKHGIRSVMASYIVSIHRHPGMSQEELAEFHSVDKSQIARMAAKMEAQGYIRRVANEQNRRLLRLYLTVSGEELYGEICRLRSEWGARAAAGVSDADVERITETVRLMNKNIDGEKK